MKVTGCIITLVSKEDSALKELSAKFHQLVMENKQTKGLFSNLLLILHKIFDQFIYISETSQLD